MPKKKKNLQFIWGPQSASLQPLHVPKLSEAYSSKNQPLLLLNFLWLILACSWAGIVWHITKNYTKCPLWKITI